jgi:hypothetical protein
MTRRSRIAAERSERVACIAPGSSRVGGEWMMTFRQQRIQAMPFSESSA